MTLEPCGRFEWERVLVACDLPKTTKLVGLMLAIYTNAGGGNAHPGNRRLAAWCGLGEQAIERNLKTLRELGLVERVEKGRGNRYYRRADCYRLTVPDDLHDRVTLLPDPGLSGNGASPSTVLNPSPVTGSRIQNPSPGTGSNGAAEFLNPSPEVLNPSLATLEPVAGDAPTSMYNTDALPTRMDRSSSEVTSAEVEGEPAEHSKTSTKDHREREDEFQATYRAASLTMLELDAETALAIREKAVAELGEDARHEDVMIRAAELARAGAA